MERTTPSAGSAAGRDSSTTASRRHLSLATRVDEWRVGRTRSPYISRRATSIDHEGHSRHRSWSGGSSLLGRPVAFPGAVVLPRVARHPRALQTDGDRHRVGINSARSHDGDLYLHLRTARQVADAGGTLSDPRAFGAPALAIL